MAILAMTSHGKTSCQVQGIPGSHFYVAHPRRSLELTSLSRSATLDFWADLVESQRQLTRAIEFLKES